MIVPTGTNRGHPRHDPGSAQGVPEGATQGLIKGTQRIPGRPRGYQEVTKGAMALLEPGPYFGPEVEACKNWTGGEPSIVQHISAYSAWYLGSTAL